MSSGYAGVTAEQGSYYLNEGPVGSDEVLSQTFSDTAGETLTFSGWVNGAPDNNSGPSNFFVTFDGTTEYYQAPVNTNGWLNVTFTAIATGSDTLGLNFRNDPAFNSLDNSRSPGSAPFPRRPPGP